jgi:hypothetical protein
MSTSMFLLEQKQAYKAKADSLADGVWKRRFTEWAEIAEMASKFPVGKSHDHADSHDCTCHEDDRLQNWLYLMQYVGDPIRVEAVGLAMFIPGEAGLQGSDIPLIRKIGEPYLNSMFVMSTEERVRIIAAQSRHPLKKKMPILPLAFGHLYNVAEQVPIFMDDKALENFMAYMQLSTTQLALRRRPVKTDANGALADFFKVPVYAVGLLPLDPASN